MMAAMTYKLDGAKFACLEELVEALYPLYEDRMSPEEFRAYAEESAERGESAPPPAGESCGGPVSPPT